MSEHPRHRLERQEGFTLIELLIVVIIIGVLAAVAIPTFLTQTRRAYDAGVIAAIDSAHTAEATYLTAHNTYVDASRSNPSPLTAIEPTLAGAFSNDSLQVVGASGNGYTITATDPKSNITFALTYQSDGSALKTCYAGSRSTAASRASAQDVGSCSNTNTWGG